MKEENPELTDKLYLNIKDLDEFKNELYMSYGLCAFGTILSTLGAITTHYASGIALGILGLTSLGGGIAFGKITQYDFAKYVEENKEEQEDNYKRSRLWGYK
jgi:hypothetical protein